VKNELTVFLIATLFASSFIGTASYSNRLSLTNFLQCQSSQNQATTFAPANLSANLYRKEVTDKLVLVTMYPETSSINVRYNSLWITGGINNIGEDVAFNAGLQVIAYGTDRSQIVNITVPLVNAVYGTDKATKEFITNFAGYFVTIDGIVERGQGPADSLALGNDGLLSLGTLMAGQTVDITLAIYFEGTVSNWIVTPVWTNIP
jgi:hypothetical protein